MYSKLNLSRSDIKNIIGETEMLRIYAGDNTGFFWGVKSEYFIIIKALKKTYIV